MSPRAASVRAEPFAEGRDRPRHRPALIISGALSVPSPTSASVERPSYLGELYEWSVHSTATGTVTSSSERTTASAVMELRRLSGLTWDQLAQLFGVARRSVHFWASGKPLSAPNEEQLRRTLWVVRGADRGSASANRARLLEPGRDGRNPYELLAEARYEEARKLLGPGNGEPSRPLAEIEDREHEQRRPDPVERRVGALHDPVHREAGTVRRVRTKKKHGA